MQELALDILEIGMTAMVQCIMQLGFTVVMWLRSEIWLVLPTFRQ